MKTSIVSAIFATMATLASAAALPVEESSVEATETFDKRAQVFSWWNADDVSHHTFTVLKDSTHQEASSTRALTAQRPSQAMACAVRVHFPIR